MTVLLALAGGLVTALTVGALVLLVPGGSESSGQVGAFGQEAADHGSIAHGPLYPDR